VDTGNVALIDPSATVIVEGTVADRLLLASPTVIPPSGAATFKVKVPVELVPPATVVGFSDKLERER
jgi:hypothetical protein